MIEQPSSNYWRLKAGEYRILAESTIDDYARRAFYKLAEDSDSLAWRQERLAEFAAAKATGDGDSDHIEPRRDFLLLT